ncbi:hypothetical protein F52700_7462 [Fusarium sp. NRRL 52700]|nr:hypothetical protein F52700_7462 [Fusarium sp. NRRL 52700]
MHFSSLIPALGGLVAVATASPHGLGVGVGLGLGVDVSVGQGGSSAADTTSKGLVPTSPPVSQKGGVPSTACNLANSWENHVLFDGIAAPASGAAAAIKLGLNLPNAQIEGEATLELVEGFLKEPRVRIGLAAIKAYVELDISASAAVHESIELFASSALQLEVPGLLEAEAGAALALDLVVGVDAAIDLSAGVYLAFGEEAFVEVSLLTKEIVDVSLEGLVAKALPIGVAAEVDLSAEVSLTLGLRLRTEIDLSAELDIPVLDIEAGAKIAIWVSLFEYTAVLIGTDNCVVSVDELIALTLGLAVELDVEVGDILDISLAPTLTVTIATAAQAKICQPNRGTPGGFIKKLGNPTSTYTQSLSVSTAPAGGSDSTTDSALPDTTGSVDASGSADVTGSATADSSDSYPTPGSGSSSAASAGAETTGSGSGAYPVPSASGSETTGSGSGAETTGSGSGSSSGASAGAETTGSASGSGSGAYPVPSASGSETTGSGSSAETTGSGSGSYPIPGSGSSSGASAGAETTGSGSGAYPIPSGSGSETYPAGAKTTGSGSGSYPIPGSGSSSGSGSSASAGAKTTGSGSYPITGSGSSSGASAGAQTTGSGSGAHHAGSSSGAAKPQTTGDVTSTVTSTHVYTITSCAASVINCPARYTQKVVTSTVIESTYVCPATETGAVHATTTAHSTKVHVPVTTLTDTLTTIVPCKTRTTKTFHPPTTPPPAPTVTIVDTTTYCPEEGKTAHPSKGQSTFQVVTTTGSPNTKAYEVPPSPAAPTTECEEKPTAEVPVPGKPTGEGPVPGKPTTGYPTPGKPAGGKPVTPPAHGVPYPPSNGTVPSHVPVYPAPVPTTGVPVVPAPVPTKGYAPPPAVSQPGGVPPAAETSVSSTPVPVSGASVVRTGFMLALPAALAFFIRGNEFEPERREAGLGARPAVRRVKCDEARPSCLRCMSTGRTCDGYEETAAEQVLQDLPPIQTVIAGYGNSQEARSIQFFIERTLSQLTSFFPDEFWGISVLQIAQYEPSISHALVSFSAYHEAFTNGIPGDKMPFALKHYNLSIKELYASHSSLSHVHLVSCLVFICIEANPAGTYRNCDSTIQAWPSYDEPVSSSYRPKWHP